MEPAEALALFEGLQAEFPQLRMNLEREHIEVDFNVDIPVQPGLPFAVNLNLQGDELHLSAGFCWLSWSPTSDPVAVERYCEAVRCILAGTHRLVEHWAGGRAVRGEIQALVEGDWRTLGGRRSIRDWLPGRRERRVLQSGVSSPTTR